MIEIRPNETQNNAELFNVCQKKLFLLTNI